MKKNIYIVVCNYLRDSQSVKVNQDCYTTKEKAIDFINSRLNEEEKQKNENAKNRNLLKWYEFYSKNYYYTIQILGVE